MIVVVVKVKVSISFYRHCGSVQAVGPIGEEEVEVMVKCIVVRALRLCTSRKDHRGIRGIGKDKVQTCTGTEALYRTYGPNGEYRFR